MGTVIERIDTVLVKNIGLIDNCVASHDVSTNGYDVVIVLFICVTCVILGLVLLVCYCVFKYMSSKSIKLLKKQIEGRDDVIKQLNDKLTKSKEKQETVPVADTTLKDLKNLKLKFLEKYTKDYGEREPFDSEDCRKFLSYLDELIKENNK